MAGGLYCPGELEDHLFGHFDGSGFVSIAWLEVFKITRHRDFLLPGHHGPGGLYGSRYHSLML